VNSKRLLAALASSAAACAAAQAPASPNIIILYVDDMGYGDLGVNNPISKIPTPNLDRLATEGMNFTDGHSSSGICTPSRYAMLTGRHHWRDFHGIVTTFGAPVFKEGQLTLPQMLRERGYATACIGKWHLGWNWDAIRNPGEPHLPIQEYTSIEPGDFDWTRPVSGGPLDRGFDYYFGDDVINFPPYGWIENDKLLHAPDTLMDTEKWKPIKEGTWGCRPGPMVTGWDPYQNIPETTRRGVEYIHAQKDSAKPFFLYFSYPSPHEPIIPNDEFEGKSGAGPYGDFVYETDQSIGQLLKALEDSGQADKTLVIFSSDNGPEIYAYARDEKYDHWSSAPFRGLKQDIYEGGHHVPFIIRWPGVIQPGRVSDALISQVDLMATIAALTGYELPRHSAEDSHDFLPYLLGRVKTGPRTSMVHNTRQDIYALRDGDWVLIDAKSGYQQGREAPEEWNIKHKQPSDDEHPVELYHLKEDLQQRYNLAAKYPERVQAMQVLLKKLREQGFSAPRLATP